MQMNAIELIKQDHDVVEGLFRRWEEASSGPADRRELVETIIRELSVHAAIEEQVLYPMMRQALPDGDRLVEEALQEHQEAKEALAALDRRGPDDADFEPEVDSLVKDVRHHVQEEEGELLPKLESALSRDRLEDLGGKLEAAKEGAPTRPHPYAPTTPPGNAAAGAVAGVVDRARDAVREGAREGARKGVARRRSRSARTRGPVFHVTPASGGGWRAEKEGTERAVAIGDRKDEVVQKARVRARSQKGRLIIHGRNGRIQEERSYGPDPRRSRG
jgi:hemerythrin superfamily protein